jgi:hypothetical protein
MFLWRLPRLWRPCSLPTGALCTNVNPKQSWPLAQNGSKHLQRRVHASGMTDHLTLKRVKAVRTTTGSHWGVYMQAVMAIGQVPEETIATWVQKLNEGYRHVRRHAMTPCNIRKLGRSQPVARSLRNIHTGCVSPQFAPCAPRAGAATRRAVLLPGGRQVAVQAHAVEARLHAQQLRAGAPPPCH